MNEDILVEAGNGRIVVRLRGTSMRAVYSKGDNPWLTLSEASDDKEVKSWTPIEKPRPPL